MASKVETGIIDRAEIVDMVIYTATARATGLDPTGVETEDKEGTWIRAGIRGTHPTLTTSKTDSGSITETRNITMELGQANIRDGGE